MPCATDALGWDFVAGLKPAARSRASARATLRPSTLGTAALPGPLDTATLTRVPFATLLPRGGLSEITSPIGAVELAASDATGASPARLSLATATCSVCPVTSGTVTLATDRASSSASATASAISAADSAASSTRRRRPGGAPGGGACSRRGRAEGISRAPPP